MSADYTGTKRTLVVNGVTVEARRARFYLRTYHMGGDFYTWKSGWDFFVDGEFLEGGHSKVSALGTQTPYYKTIADFVEAWQDPINASDWQRLLSKVRG